MSMIDDAIRGSIRSSGLNELKLTLVSNSSLQLSSLAKILVGLSAKGESETLENVRFDDSARVLIKLQLKVSKPGEAERLYRIPPAGEVEVILWEGDSEYWQECAEKVVGLIEAGCGHQDLLIRGSENQQCTLSYCE